MMEPKQPEEQAEKNLATLKFLQMIIGSPLVHVDVDNEAVSMFFGNGWMVEFSQKGVCIYERVKDGKTTVQ